MTSMVRAKYSTESADDRTSCSSSFVALNYFSLSTCAQELERVVGRIQLIFNHPSNEHERMFASVHCFNRPECVDFTVSLNTCSIT